MKIRLSLAVPLVTAALAAGCGGDDAKVGAPARSTAAPSLSPSPSPVLDERAAYASLLREVRALLPSQGQAAVEVALERMDAATPPADLAVKHQEVVIALRKAAAAEFMSIDESYFPALAAGSIDAMLTKL